VLLGFPRSAHAITALMSLKDALEFPLICGRLLLDDIV
jgi:hypothetical protein